MIAANSDNFVRRLALRGSISLSFSRTLQSVVVVAEAALFASPVGASELFHRAENRVPLAIVHVTRAAAFTEIHIQTQVALKKVCWPSSGPDSPYLLAIGRRFRYLDGENVTACPVRRDYADHEIMVLRFAPLEAQVSTFSFVGGQADENRSISPASAAGRDWNFLRVPVK
jgi:hypothetical protein